MLFPDSSGEDSPRPCNVSGSLRDGEGLEHRVEVPHDVVHGVRAHLDRRSCASSLPVTVANAVVRNRTIDAAAHA